MRTGKAWEDLIREKVFKPLGIVHAGFGAPGNSKAIDQPRGHVKPKGGAAQAMKQVRTKLTEELRPFD